MAKNSSNTDISSYLKVSDTDAGQTETWTVSVGTDHGGTVTAGTTHASGTSVVPTGWKYTPAADFVGTETFTIQVSDGTATATRSFSITVTNSAPVLTAGGSSSFTERSATPVVVDSTVTLADSDNTTETSATFATNGGTKPTTTLVAAALRGITYSNSSPPTADGAQSVQLDWTFHDGNSGSQGTGGDLTGTGSTTVTLSQQLVLQFGATPARLLIPVTQFLGPTKMPGHWLTSDELPHRRLIVEVQIAVIAMNRKRHDHAAVDEALGQQPPHHRLGVSP